MQTENSQIAQQTREDKKIDKDRFLFFAFVASFFSISFGTAPPTFFSAIALLIWLISGKFLSIKIYKQSWFWPFVLVFILPWIGLLYASEITEISIKQARKTHYWLYGLALTAVCFDRFSSEKFVKAFLFGLTINSLIAIFQFLMTFSKLGIYASYHGLGSQYSSVAMYLVLGILVASYYFAHASKKNRFIYSLLMALYFFHIVIMNGRNGYFTVLVLSPLILKTMAPKIHIYQQILICFIILGLMCLSPFVRERMMFSVNQIKLHLNSEIDSEWGKKHTVLEERVFMTRNAAKIIMDHPVLGLGTGGFQLYMEKRGANEIDHPHNNILYMAVNYGIIGVIAILWLFYEVFKKAWYNRGSPLGFFILSIVLVIFFSGLFNTQIIDAGTAFLFSAAIGLQSGLKENKYSSVTA